MHDSVHLSFQRAATCSLTGSTNTSVMLKTDAPPTVNCELVMVLLGTDDIVPEVALRLQVVDEPHRILLVFPCEDTVNVHHSAQQKSFAMLQKTMRAKRLLETETVQHFPHTFFFFFANLGRIPSVRRWPCLEAQIALLPRCLDPLEEMRRQVSFAVCHTKAFLTSKTSNEVLSLLAQWN